MTRIDFICTYCGHKFTEECSSKSELEDVQCPKCLDHNVEAFPEVSGKGDVFGYNYVPPGKKKKK